MFAHFSREVSATTLSRLEEKITFNSVIFCHTTNHLQRVVTLKTKHSTHHFTLFRIYSSAGRFFCSGPAGSPCGGLAPGLEGSFSALWLFILRVSQGSDHDSFSFLPTCSPLMISANSSSTSKTEFLTFHSNVLHSYSFLYYYMFISSLYLFKPELMSHFDFFLCFPPLSNSPVNPWF